MIFKLKKALLPQIRNHELLEQYNAYPAIDQEQIRSGYSVEYTYNTVHKRLQAKVIGDPNWNWTTYFWTPYKNGRGIWNLYQRNRKPTKDELQRFQNKT